MYGEAILSATEPSFFSVLGVMIISASPTIRAAFTVINSESPGPTPMPYNLPFMGFSYSYSYILFINFISFIITNLYKIYKTTI